jgi:UDP-N-acetylmuramyl pentapeptide synthase
MHYELQKVAEILSYSTEFDNNIYIDNVALDSRINLTQHTLFFCIVGDRNNGHHYIKNAYNKGVRCFVISENIETKNISRG